MCNKNIFKKIIVWICCIIFVLQSGIVVSAENNDSDDVEVLFEELNHVVSSYNKGNISLSERDRKIEEIELSLEQFGFTPISQEEAIAKKLIKDKYNDSNRNYAIVPGSTTNTKFYNRREKYSSDKYEIQTIRAVPLTEKSSLAESDMITMYQKNQMEAGALTVIKATVTSTATALSSKVNIAYTAYDLLNKTYSSITGKSKIGNSKVIYDYDIQTNVCFKYVKKVGESDDKQILSHISTMYSGYCNTYYKKFTYNSTSYTADSIVQKENIEVKPSKYNNNLAALSYYLGNTSIYKYYAPNFTIQGLEGKIVEIIYPITPEFPLQVY